MDGDAIMYACTAERAEIAENGERRDLYIQTTARASQRSAALFCALRSGLRRAGSQSSNKHRWTQIRLCMLAPPRTENCVKIASLSSQ